MRNISVKLYAYNNTKIPVFGKCTSIIKHKEVETPVLFIVVDTNSEMFSTQKTCETLNLIWRILNINKKNLPNLLK